MVEGDTATLPKAELENKIGKWGYETRFKHYLYRTAILGNEGVESIHNFPARIGLDDVWHGALNRMRAESRDGVERWSPVGMKVDRALDFIPKQFVKGYHTKAITLTKEEVEKEYGIVHQAGEIHSHPSDWFNTLGVNLIVATRLVKDFEGFSPPDLYYMVDGRRIPLDVVVEKHHNYFAFRTAETKDVPADSPLGSDIAFARHWARKQGGHYLGKSHLTFWASPKFSSAKMNIGIAEAYNLALYKGSPGEDLVRQYP